VKRLCAVLALIAALAAPPLAAAKDETKLTICGQDGCQRAPLDVPGGFLANALVQALATSETVPAPPPPQAYFRIHVQGAKGREKQAWYVPKAGLIETSSGWIEADPASILLEDATRFLRSFPAPKPTSARVNGRAASNPGLYAGLLADLPSADAPPADAPVAVVDLRYGKDGPWTEARLSYSPSEDVVRRTDGWVAVPDALAARVESDLRQEGVASHNGWGSALVFGLILTGALFVGWLTFLRQKWWKTPKRRRGPVREPPPEGPRSDSTR
jgi:hypothetical protein